MAYGKSACKNMNTVLVGRDMVPGRLRHRPIREDLRRYVKRQDGSEKWDYVVNKRGKPRSTSFVVDGDE